jgi:hypothetical protein
MKSITPTPDFIIIGAMKCATSTLHDQLGHHAEFFMTTPKEPCFFSDDEIYRRGIEWYHSLYQDAQSGQIKGESSTHYSKLPNYPSTVKRLKEHCPHVKIIYLMRHPVDRLISHYIHEWTQKIITCDIDQAIIIHPELVQYSCYNMQIEPYLDAFGSEVVKPVFVEKLRLKPQEQLADIFNFLEARSDPVWNPEIKKNVSAQRMRKNRLRDAIIHNRLLTLLRRALVPKYVRNQIARWWTMEKRPQLSIESLKSVESVFDPDLKLLGRKLGINLNCQTFNQTVSSICRNAWVS